MYYAFHPQARVMHMADSRSMAISNNPWGCQAANGFEGAVIPAHQHLSQVNLKTIDAWNMK